MFYAELFIKTKSFGTIGATHIWIAFSLVAAYLVLRITITWLLRTTLLGSGVLPYLIPDPQHVFVFNYLL